LTAKLRNPFQGCEQSPRAFLNPGFQSKPWAGIGQRFQRYSILPRTLEAWTLCAKPALGLSPTLPSEVKSYSPTLRSESLLLKSDGNSGFVGLVGLEEEDRGA